MNKLDKATRVFLACATGAGIGTLTALQLGHFWGLGALLGGLVGYLIYDLEQVFAMIPAAWNKAVNWKPDPKWWKALGLTYLGLLSAVTSFAILPLMITKMMDGKPISNSYINGIIFITLIFMAIFTLGIAQSNDPTGVFFIKCTNPFTVYIYYPYKGLCWALPRIPAGITIGARFVKTLFILIHSDMRLLCGVDALIGATIGYFSGNVLIGALAGGVLGVVNYELVSKRLLGLRLRS